MTLEPTSYVFTDPVSGQQCALHLVPVGVEHPGCDKRASVTPDLDSFYCTACGWNGRISGAWVMTLVNATPEAHSDWSR